MVFGGGSDVRQLLVAWGLVMTAAAVTSMGVADAQDKSDVTGTWKEERGVPSSMSTTIYKLNRNGEKLSGSVHMRGREYPIENGTVKDRQVSFTAKHIAGKTQLVFKWSGKMTGNTIKGDFQADMVRNGVKLSSHTRAWEAKRGKE